MTHIKRYRRGRKWVKGHDRRTYKGYRSRRSIMADRRKHARHKPAKHYKKHLGNRGDW